MGIGDWGLGIGDWALYPVLIFPNDIERSVSRTAIDDDILQSRIVLRCHTQDGLLERCLAIIRDSYDRYLRLHYYLFTLNYSLLIDVHQNSHPKIMIGLSVATSEATVTKQFQTLFQMRLSFYKVRQYTSIFLWHHREVTFLNLLRHL